MKTKGLFGEVNVTGSCDYMIEVSYGEKDWGMPQGIREVLANMLDTKTEYDAHYDKDNGYCVILDHGTGLPKKALVMELLLRLLIIPVSVHLEKVLN